MTQTDEGDINCPKSNFKNIASLFELLIVIDKSLREITNYLSFCILYLLYESLFIVSWKVSSAAIEALNFAQTFKILHLC